MLKTSSKLALLANTPKYSKFYSTSVNLRIDDRLESFRTVETNPINHTRNNLAQFYTLPPQDKEHIFPHGGIPKSFGMLSKTFNETCLMIRKPALEVIHSLKSLDYSKPAVRFVLYGVQGSGKSMSLAHILHFGNKAGFLLVHVPWVANWMRRCKESSNSETCEGFIDLNIDAADWLLHFRTQNAHILSKDDLIISEEYIWSKREKTGKGAHILELIDHGINRIKYASDCVVSIAEEIKKLTQAGKCKTLVVIDGFNAFYHPKTRVYTEKKEIVHPQKITITKAFLNLTKFDWNNSAIVVSVDELAIIDKDRTSHYPRYLLGKEGFEQLDPFVPIKVENYNTKEFLSCTEYYRERKWIHPYSGQDDELAFISNSNPYKLMEISAPL